MDSKAAPELHPVPKKQSSGCGWILGGCGALIVVAIVVGIAQSTANKTTADSIEKARTVLEGSYGESYSYDELKQTTDAALANMGEPVDDDGRNRAWSTVLNVIDKAPELAHVSPMDVMRCAAADDSGTATGVGFTLPEIIAVCAVALR